MKNVMKYFCICIALLFSAPSFAQVFEGVIRLETENTEAQEKSSITWYIKGQRHRMDYSMSTQQGSVDMRLYMEPNSGSVTLVSGGNKQTVDISAMQQSPYLDNIILVAPQQETKDVAGFQAQKYVAKGTNSSIDLFITTQLAISMPPVFSAKGIWKALQENGIKGLPLEMVAKNTQGNVVFTQRVISVENRTVSESELAY